MEGYILLLLLVLAWLFVAPIIVIVKASAARSQTQRSEMEVEILKRQLELLKSEVRELRRSAPSAAVRPAVAIPAPPLRAALAVEPAPTPSEPPVADLPVAEQSDLAAQLDKLWFATPTEPVVRVDLVDPARSQPPPIPPQAERPEPVADSDAPASPPFSFEHFMGVKLFAWLGGVALFFGIIFFVKYAFENNLIPPAVRVALGFVTGIGLLVGGLWMHRRESFLVLAHSFCATGVLILYGVTFAAHAIYHFPVFSSGATFALMALITVVAFLVAVRLDALVVAVLGMLGGFITPVLLSTGHDQLLGLFSYIALLVIGLAAVAQHRNWSFLVPAAAVGTALMQIGWADAYFVQEHYDLGAKTLLPMGVLVFFMALFLAVAWSTKRRNAPTGFSAGSALGMGGMALLFGFAMLEYPNVSQRIPLLFGFLLLQNLAVLGVAWISSRLMIAHLINALLTFLLLAIWMGNYLITENLIPALAVVLVFGAFHAVVPVLLARLVPMSDARIKLRIWPWMTSLSLLVLLLPMVNLPEPSLLIWPVVVLLNFLAIVLAAMTGAMLPVLGGLFVTVLLVLQWLFNAPMRIDSLSPFLGILLGFSSLFALAGRWLVGKLGPAEPDASPMAMVERQIAGALPVLAGLLPFGLLLLAIQRLPIANPSAVFGVALLLVVLLLGLAIIGCRAAEMATDATGLVSPSALIPAAFAGLFAVQALWHGVSFQSEISTIPLVWYLGCYAMFLAFPFVFKQTSASHIWPWITAAVAGIGYFLLVHNLVQRSFPSMADRMGLIPIAFAIPSLLSLAAVVRMASQMDAVKRSQLAWFGGVALFFITLVFPIQFDRQWLTVSWALEGALLLWLFRRVSHLGLLFTGLALLAVSFVRLALNPAVFTDYPRSETPILNWHLYTYGIVAIAQFLGARWFSDPTGQLKSLNARAILYSFGGLLCFILLNLEIADYFTPVGQRTLSFGNGVNFQRDMTYSIAWGLFALGLLSLGIWFKARPARYAAIGLLVLTLLKVFIHDLSSLASVFRIGALIGVAIIAFIASFLYQQFFNRSKSS